MTLYLSWPGARRLSVDPLNSAATFASDPRFHVQYAYPFLWNFLSAGTRWPRGHGEPRTTLAASAAWHLTAAAQIARCLVTIAPWVRLSAELETFELLAFFHWWCASCAFFHSFHCASCSVFVVCLFYLQCGVISMLTFIFRGS